MKDPYARLKDFKGWFPDVDPRDVDEDTFADLLGYDPSRIQGSLIKDFGYSDAYTSAAGTLAGGGTLSSLGDTVTATSGTAFLTELQIGSTIVVAGQTRVVATIETDLVLTTTVDFSPVLSGATSFTYTTGYPSGLTILAMKTLYVKSLATEYQIVVGKTAANKLKIYSRGFYDGAMYGGWFDLTEYYTGLVVSAIGATDITIEVTQEYAPDHFKGYVLVVGGNNIITCTASARVDATHQILTISENVLTLTSERLDPNADVAAGVWTYLSGASLFDMLDDGDDPLTIERDTDVIQLGISQTANQCKIGFSNIVGTPDATGYTRLYYRAYGVGYSSGSVPGTSTIIIDLRESGSSLSVLTRSVPVAGRYAYTEGYIEVANAAITNHNNLEAWITGTTPANAQLRVSWMKITVDITDTIGTVDAYRYPIMMQMASYFLDVGATPFVTLSRSNDKISLAIIDTSAVVLPPVQVLYVNNEFFSSLRSYDALYFESAMFTKEYLGRGIELNRTLVAANSFKLIVVPIVDGYQYGDPIFKDDGDGYVYNFKVDWGVFNKRVTGLEIYSEWTPTDPTKNPATLEGQRVYFENFIDITGDNALWSEDALDRLYTAYTGGNTYSSENIPAEATLDGARGASFDTGAVRYRYHKPMTRRQSSLVAVDENDSVIRFSFYDAGGVHNDDVFINSSIDLYGNATMAFLSAPGELLGLAERLGMLYCFKQTTVEVIDMNTFSTAVFPIDCVAKRGLKETAAGIVFVGQYGIFLFPQGGGKEILINRQFLDTYRQIGLASKKAAIVEENRAHNSIIINIADTAYIYNYNTQQWWKRKLNNVPVYLSAKIDGIFQFTDGTKIYKYPDRTTYLDDSAGVEFKIESQWMSHGMPWIQKLLRNLSVAGQTNNPGNYRIEIYTDRNNVVWWDYLEVTLENSLISGKDTDVVYPIKTPNSYREIKFIVTKRDGSTYSQYGQLDFREFRLYGEVGRTGKEG